MRPPKCPMCGKRHEGILEARVAHLPEFRNPTEMFLAAGAIALLGLKNYIVPPRRSF